MANIDLTIEDYKFLNSYEGYSVGLNTAVLNYKDTLKQVSNFSKQLKMAKAVIIEISVNGKTSTMTFYKLIEEVNKFVHDDCNIILGSKIDNNLKIDELQISMLIGGLKEMC